MIVFLCPRIPRRNYNSGSGMSTVSVVTHITLATRIVYSGASDTGPAIGVLGPEIAHGQ